MAPPQWAYQVENFVTQPDEELICSICYAVFCDPVLCSCDHVFCKVCITKWLQKNSNCPICRKEMYNTSIKQTVRIIKNLIMKLMLNCRNKSLGCKAQFSVESSEAHGKECEYEFVQCKNVPCTDMLFRKDIIEHETEDCRYRYIKCKLCKRVMLPNLTAGSINRILNGEEMTGVVIQILGQWKAPCSRCSRNDHYRLLISDGVNSCPFVLLGTQLNSLITNKELVMFTIVRVDKYVCNQIKPDKKVIILLNLVILVSGAEIGEKMGNPVNCSVSSSSAAPAANITENNV